MPVEAFLLCVPPNTPLGNLWGRGDKQEWRTWSKGKFKALLSTTSDGLWPSGTCWRKGLGPWKFSWWKALGCLQPEENTTSAEAESFCSDPSQEVIQLTTTIKAVLDSSVLLPAKDFKGTRWVSVTEKTKHPWAWQESQHSDFSPQLLYFEAVTGYLRERGRAPVNWKSLTSQGPGVTYAIIICRCSY